MGGEIHALLLRGFSHGRTAHSFACSFAKPEFPTPLIGKNARVYALLFLWQRHHAATPLIGKNARVYALLFLWQRHHAAEAREGVSPTADHMAAAPCRPTPLIGKNARVYALFLGSGTMPPEAREGARPTADHMAAAPCRRRRHAPYHQKCRGYSLFVRDVRKFFTVPDIPERVFQKSGTAAAG